MSKSFKGRAVAVRGVESLEGRRLFAQLFPGEVYGVGLNPTAVISADFNGDGRPDLATANQVAADQGSVSILLGRGDGTFATAARVLTSSATASVAAADFNGDGKVDLVTADPFASTASVALGAGDGTFATPVSYDAGAPHTLAVVTGDFNGDGKTDVAVSSDNNSTTAPGTVSVLLGAGDGTLGAATTFAVGPRPLAITAADVNGDGKTDLVTANANASGTLSVLGGVGNGTFAPATPLTVGAQPQAVVAADLDGDGKTDLATANLGGTVSVRRGNGDGTFAAATTVTAGTRARTLVAADADLDGDLDLLVAGGSIDGRVFVLTNTNGALARTAAYVTGFDPASITAADFNGDGRPDVATTAFKGNNASVAPYTSAVVVLVSGAAGGLVAPQNYPVPDRPRNVAYGYINGDDKLDIVTANTGNSEMPGSISVLFGNGDGTFTRGSDVILSSKPGVLALGDFNRDGITDLVINDADPRTGADTVRLYYGNGSGGFNSVFSAPVGNGPWDIEVGDFNNDGRSDLAVTNFGGGLTVLLGNAAGTFNTPTSYPTGNNPYEVADADLNLDGKPDLIVANHLSGSLSVFHGKGDGTFAAPVSVNLGGAPVALSVADFNRDGRPDIAVGNLDGSVTLVRNNANGTFTRTTTQIGAGVSDVVAGDFNGDGLADVAAADPNVGTISVLTGRGNGTFEPRRSFAADLGVYGLDAADFNADGKTDLFSGSTLNFPNNLNVIVLLNQSPSPYVGIAYDVLTISGTTQPITVDRADDSLLIATPAGLVTVAASGIRQIVLNGVNVTFASDLGPAAGNGAIGLSVGRTSTATFASSQHLAALTVNGTATLAADGNRVLRTTALTLGPAGRLDLADNAMIYDYAGNTPRAASVGAAIASARAGGTWTGVGLTSSAARDNPARTTALGYAEASDYQSIFGSAAKFAGEFVGSGAVLVRYTYYGDTDLDRSVSIYDFNRQSASFGRAGQTWFGGDFDYDTGVSINDFNLLSTNFGAMMTTTPTPPPTQGQGKSVAPAKRR